MIGQYTQQAVYDAVAEGRSGARRDAEDIAVSDDDGPLRVLRRRVTQAPQPAEGSDGGGFGRRRGDPPSIDELRAELQWKYAEEAAPERFSLLHTATPNVKKAMGSRFFWLALALIAGSLVAVNLIAALQPRAPLQEAPVEVTETVVPEPRTRVLVAKSAIGIGQRLDSSVLNWQDWPTGAVIGDYITFSDAPGAANEMNDAVARYDLFEGDPVRKSKIVRASDGYLSAVLTQGQRGVSVSVNAESAAGGFISPNDHVDVVMTQNTPTGDISKTVLHNVRVLAIDARLGETGQTGQPGQIEGAGNAVAEIFVKQAIATLALDPKEAEVLISAAAGGNLSLVLRSMADFSQDKNAAQSGSNEAIRITSPFWGSQGGNSAIK